MHDTIFSTREWFYGHRIKARNISACNCVPCEAQLKLPYTYNNDSVPPHFSCWCKWRFIEEHLQTCTLLILGAFSSSFFSAEAATTSTTSTRITRLDQIFRLEWRYLFYSRKMLRVASLGTLWPTINQPSSNGKYPLPAGRRQFTGRCAVRPTSNELWFCLTPLQCAHAFGVFIL